MFRILMILSLIFLLGCKEKVDLSKFNLNDIEDVYRAMENMSDEERNSLFNNLRNREYSIETTIERTAFTLFKSYFEDGYSFVDLSQDYLNCVISDEHRNHILRYVDEGQFNCNGPLVRYKEGNFGHYFLYIRYSPTDDQTSFVNSLPEAIAFTDRNATGTNWTLERMTDLTRDRFWEDNGTLTTYFTGSISDVRVSSSLTGNKTGIIEFSDSRISCSIPEIYLFILDDLKKGHPFTCVGEAEGGSSSGLIRTIDFDPRIGVAQ